jgi:hypothetical protein
MLERVLATTAIGALKTAVREYPFPVAPPDGGFLAIGSGSRLRQRLPGAPN